MDSCVDWHRLLVELVGEWALRWLELKLHVDGWVHHVGLLLAGVGHRQRHGSWLWHLLLWLWHGLWLHVSAAHVVLGMVVRVTHSHVDLATATVVGMAVALVVVLPVLVVLALLLELALHGSSVVTTHLLDWSLLLLNRVHEQSQQSGDLVVALEVLVDDVLSLVTLPVLLVLVGFIQKVALLFHFVVVNVQGLAVHLQVGILALASRVWGLEAHESEWHLAVPLLE